jgi:hypothetical protein
MPLVSKTKVVRDAELRSCGVRLGRETKRIAAEIFAKWRRNVPKLIGFRREFPRGAKQATWTLPAGMDWT